MWRGGMWWSIHLPHNSRSLWSVDGVKGGGGRFLRGSATVGGSGGCGGVEGGWGGKMNREVPRWVVGGEHGRWHRRHLRHCWEGILLSTESQEKSRGGGISSGQKTKLDRQPHQGWCHQEFPHRPYLRAATRQ
jgi:hypothetical protein